MKKTVLIYGLISGALSAAMMAASVPYMIDMYASDHGKAAIYGYTAIFLASLLIFFGVRSYRERVGGGRISFGRGMAVGALIALVSAVCYTSTWQLIYFGSSPETRDKIMACVVREMNGEPKDAAGVAKAAAKAAEWRRFYDNPLLNFGMTLLEPLPVGLLVSVISAGILRRKEASA
jgi:hypothetical protein